MTPSSRALRGEGERADRRACRDLASDRGEAVVRGDVTLTLPLEQSRHSREWPDVRALLRQMSGRRRRQALADPTLRASTPVAEVLANQQAGLAKKQKSSERRSGSRIGTAAGTQSLVGRLVQVRAEQQSRWRDPVRRQAATRASSASLLLWTVRSRLRPRWTSRASGRRDRGPPSCDGG